MARSDKRVSLKGDSHGPDRKGYIRRDDNGQFGAGRHDERSIHSNGYSKLSYGATNQQGVYRKGRAFVHVDASKGKALVGSVLSQAAKTVSQTSVPSKKPSFSHDIFTSEEEYNQSVESVVARIRSGQVTAREPDE
jgi:hypothetical protein